MSRSPRPGLLHPSPSHGLGAIGASLADLLLGTGLFPFHLHLLLHDPTVSWQTGSASSAANARSRLSASAPLDASPITALEELFALDAMYRAAPVRGPRSGTARRSRPSGRPSARVLTIRLAAPNRADDGIERAIRAARSRRMSRIDP
jgi:hypothetical protein